MLDIHSNNGKTKIKQTLLKLLQSKKQNGKDAKSLIQHATELVRKEKLIIDLRKEYECHSKLNTLYHVYLHKAAEVKDDIKTSYDTIQKVCNQIRIDFHEIVLIIEKNEKIIEDIRTKRKEQIRAYTAVLDQKNTENRDLTKALNDILVKIKKNEIYTQKLIDQVEQLKQQKEKDYNDDIENNREVLLKIDIYEKRIAKFNIGSAYYDAIHLTNKELKNVLSQSATIQVDLDIELKDKELKNDYLKREVKKLSTKIDYSLNEMVVYRSKSSLYGCSMRTRNMKIPITSLNKDKARLKNSANNRHTGFNKSMGSNEKLTFG